MAGGPHLPRTGGPWPAGFGGAGWPVKAACSAPTACLPPRMTHRAIEQPAATATPSQIIDARGRGVASLPRTRRIPLMCSRSQAREIDRGRGSIIQPPSGAGTGVVLGVLSVWIASNTAYFLTFLQSFGCLRPNGFAFRRSPGIQNERPRCAGPFSWPDRDWLQRYTPSHAPGCTDALSPSALAVGRFSVNMLSGETTEKSM